MTRSVAWVMLAAALVLAVALPAMAGAGLYDRLEADRLLLVEIRKGIPAEREAGLAALARMEELAARSDPGRLLPLIKRAKSLAPAFYDWVEQTFDDPVAQQLAYLLGGARDFQRALDAFVDSVLLAVINHLEALRQG